jgi:hypothetical protein
MRIFMSGEIDKSVYDIFSQISNDVETRLKILKDKNYGNEVLNIGIIPIIATESLIDKGFFKERRLFQRKTKGADYRLRINIDRFLNGDDETKRLLIIKNIIVAVRDLGRKAKKDFDAQSLERDILEILGVTKERIEAIDMY